MSKVASLMACWARRRSGAGGDGGDLPALMLRLSIGPMLMAHGANKVAGPGGLEGTTRYFRSLGLEPAWLQARLAAATEIGAGGLITLGAANPLPSAAVIGLMATAARTDHRGKGFFVFRGGWEYVAVNAAVAATIAAMGPGRLSVDHLLGRRRRGLRWALLAAAIGLAASEGLLATSYHPAGPGPGSADGGQGAADEPRSQPVR